MFDTFYNKTVGGGGIRDQHAQREKKGLKSVQLQNPISQLLDVYIFLMNSTNWATLIPPSTPHFLSSLPLYKDFFQPIKLLLAEFSWANPMKLAANPFSSILQFPPLHCARTPETFTVQKVLPWFPTQGTEGTRDWSATMLPLKTGPEDPTPGSYVSSLSHSGSWTTVILATQGSAL